MLYTKNIKNWLSFNKLASVVSRNALVELKQMSVNSIHTKPTAGIIIIGDEIIKGQVQDTNTNFLCHNLYKLGVHVERVSVIRDDVYVIATEVQEFSKKYRYVLTSGGIGPTHDDLTYEGIARAFKENVHINPELEKLVKKFFKEAEKNSPAIKLATIPQSAKLHHSVDRSKGSRIPFPVVSVKNVYIFPGVPHLLEKLFDHVGKELFNHPEFQLCFKQIYINQREVDITPIINEAVETFKSNLIFGSYPVLNHSYYKVKISMEAKTDAEIEAAESFFQEKLQNGVLSNYDTDPYTNIPSKMENFLSITENKELITRVRYSLSIIEECFRKFLPSQICVSFNGGKDCTVLLHLVYAVIQKRQLLEIQKLKIVYIRDKSPFPQVEQFVEQSSVRYNFKLCIFTGSVKEALYQLKACSPDVSVAIMGTRSSDPHSAHIKPFQETDPDWPKFIRVSPILDWQYSDVWDFIRALYLPYCELYDKGYTSIGHMDNTLPNPRLQYTDDNGQIQYRPAYELQEVDEERRGRL